MLQPTSSTRPSGSREGPTRIAIDLRLADPELATEFLVHVVGGHRIPVGVSPPEIGGPGRELLGPRCGFNRVFLTARTYLAHVSIDGSQVGSGREQTPTRDPRDRSPACRGTAPRTPRVTSSKSSGVSTVRRRSATSSGRPLRRRSTAGIGPGARRCRARRVLGRPGSLVSLATSARIRVGKTWASSPRGYVGRRTLAQ